MRIVPSRKIKHANHPWCFVLAWLVLMYHPTNTHADDALETFGDVAQFALPAIGLSAATFNKDWKGVKQWAFSGGTAWGTALLMKQIYRKRRPGLGSRDSFPSAHAALAFFGAGYLDQRFGKWWGLPAYVAAAVTAYSRVDTDFHFFDDTLMGASVGLMSSWLWTTPREGAFSLIPFQQNDGGGILISFNDNDKPNDSSVWIDKDRWRYVIRFGPAWPQENKVVSPAGGGALIDLDNFALNSDSITTAIAYIQRQTGRHFFQLSVVPFEARDQGRFSQPMQFNGSTYLPGETIRSRYRLTDWRLQYYFDLFPDKKLILRFGGGLSYQNLVVNLKTISNTKIETAKSDILIPLVNAILGFQFHPRLLLLAELSGVSISNQEQLDANISLLFRLSQKWDVKVDYGIYKHDTERSGLRNKAEFNLLMCSVGYSWY